MTKIKALIARRVVDGWPGGPPQGLADDLRDEREGSRNPRDEAEWLELCGMVFAGELALGDEITRRGRGLQGRKQGFGSIVKHLAIGGIAVPTFARQWHPAVLGDHECQHRLLQVRPVVFRVAMGERNGWRLALGDLRAAERKTRRVKMAQAVSNGFVLTHGKGDRAQEQITAIDVDLIKGAAECEAMEHLGVDTRTKEEIERLVVKELRGQRQGAIGKPSAIEAHPFDCLTRGDRLLCIRGKTSVDSAHESSIVDDGGNESQMISAVNTDYFHPRTSPEVCCVLWQRSQRKVNDFLEVCTCSMLVITDTEGHYPKKGAECQLWVAPSAESPSANCYRINSAPDSTP